MRRHLLGLLALAALLALPDAAFGARCGNRVGGPTFHDLRAKNESCTTARKVARAWARRRVNVFARVRVQRHTCRGAWSSKRLGGAQAFKVTCKRRRATTWWYIRQG